jgi:hypothetical protein
MTAAIILLPVVPSARLSAQVGHDPATSPFRDVTTRQALTVFGGRFNGNESEAGVGAMPGPMLGLRLQTRLSGPLDLWISVAGVNSTRLVVNPDSPLTSRTTGPINYDLMLLDMALGFNLTGLKTWHGLAPYISIGGGVEIPTQGRTDPGGYEARQNFMFIPSIGTRLALSRRISATFELRDYLIRYEWPYAYLHPTNVAVPPVLDPRKYDDKDLTSNLGLTLGLSYRFNF